MSQPPAYSPSSDFSDYATANPAAPYNGANHDTEYENIATTLAAVLANLIRIQRDDGKLANQSVHPDALSVATKNLLGSWNPRGLWVTATAYAKFDMVEQSGSSYVCAEAHTSGTFNTDAAAGKWLTVAGAGTVLASVVGFTPVGALAATNVQAALAELDAEKAKAAGDATQEFDAKDPTGGFLSRVPPLGYLQKNSAFFAIAGGSADALTATISNSGLTALTDGMEVCVRSTAANTSATPTLNLTLGSTATGAATIVRGDTGGALVAGNIGADHDMRLRYQAAGMRWKLLNVREVAAASEFAAGTRMLFQQTAAPTGWTKETAAGYNNAALRIVTGSVVGGGSSVFTTVFGAGKTSGGTSITQANLPNVNFTVTDPGHQHVEVIGLDNSGTNDGGGTTVRTTTTGLTGAATTGITVSSGGSGTAHTHSVALDVLYHDVIIAAKA